MFRRKRLGEELRELREAKGYRLQQLAAELGWSHTKLSRLENAKVRADVGEVMDLLDVLGVSPEQERRLVALARQANQRGWWRAYAEMPQRQAAFAELEASALSIQQFGLVYLPGLLQTPGYARTRFADREATAEFDVEAAIKGRTRRQEVLTRENPVRYQAVLDEGVLRRRTADPVVLRGQLEHLVTMNEQPNVSIRVLPFDADTPYLSRPLTSFTLYRFADPDEPDLVVTETETSDVQLGDPEDVARYVVMLGRVSASALDEAASSTLIRRIARE
jgi:transcriptional regulator with XRE-family HTH domain